MPSAPEHDLIRRAQQGDTDAVAGLYRQHVQAITRYVAYRVPDHAAVEDLTAEVFLRMVEGLSDYQITGAPFEAWLYRIAAARVADYYRFSQQRRDEALSDTLSSGTASLELDVQDREELDELRRALFELSEEQQTILILRFVERKSHSEVANLVNKSVDAVAAIQHRALQRLAELLGTEKSARHYLRGKSP